MDTVSWYLRVEEAKEKIPKMIPLMVGIVGVSVVGLVMARD